MLQLINTSRDRSVQSQGDMAFRCTCFSQTLYLAFRSWDRDISPKDRHVTESEVGLAKFRHIIGTEWPVSSFNHHRSLCHQRREEPLQKAYDSPKEREMTHC